MTDRTESNLSEMLERNPVFRQAVVAAVLFCAEQRDYDEAVAVVEKVHLPKTCVLSPREIVGMLVDANVLSLSIYVDGQRYEKTVEEFWDDETVPPDASVAYFVFADENEVAIARNFSSDRKITCLFQEKPERAAGLALVLQACSADEGASRDRLEELLFQTEGAIPLDPESGMPAILPAFYTGALEDAGAIVWDGVWKCTEEGRAYLGQIDKR